MPNFVGIIPTRYGSTRFPGKALAEISGKSLIQRTYENTKRCQPLDDVIVATDDQRIYDHVVQFGGKATMTSPECPTGSERVAEVAKNLQDIEIIVNIQGDEPCLEPGVIESVIEVLMQDGDAIMSTAITQLRPEETADRSVVKCVIDTQGYALYFSRAQVPGYKHLGIYGFRRDFLIQYAELDPTPLQMTENLEQLKVLEHGYRIKTVIVESQSIGVDTLDDIKKVEQLLCNQNSSLSQAESVHP